MLLPIPRCSLHATFLLLLISISMGAAPASAALHQYTVTGDVFGGLSSPNYFPSGPEPFPNGASFTMTFTLDDAVAVGPNGPTFGIYTAISNVQISFDTGDFLDTSSGDVITSVSAGGNHAWDASPDVFSGTVSTSIPDVDFEDFDGNFAFGLFAGFQAVLFDNTSSMYSQSPPELFAADLTDSTSTLVSLHWDVMGEFGQELASIDGVVTSISVPEPGFFPALAAGTVFLLARGTRRARSAEAA